MKKFILILSACCVFCFVGCQSSLYGSQPEMTTYTETTNLTAVAPTTTIPVETRPQLNENMLLGLINEAGVTLQQGTAIVLPLNMYLEYYLDVNNLTESSTVTVSNEAVTIATDYDTSLQDELEYLIFLSWLTDEYSDCLFWTDTYPDRNVNLPYAFLLFSYSEYQNEGFSTIQEYYHAYHCGDVDITDKAYYLISIKAPYIEMLVNKDMLTIYNKID